MSFADCIAEIQAAAGRELGDDEITRMAERLEREIRRRKAEGGLDGLAEAVQQAARDEAGRIALEARVARRNAALNILRRQEIDGFIGQFADPAEGLQALLVGIVRGVKGARQSIDARQKAVEAELTGGLIAELRRADLADLARSGTLDEAVARELWELRPDGRPGRSGSAEAKEIAALYAKYKEAARLRLNQAGAFIGRLDGHIAQSHDSLKLRRTPFADWAREILPRLDAERTFEGAEPMAFLARVYEDIVTGEHIGGAKAEGAYSGPANLGSLVSRARVLHFRSADDWLAYNRQFGRGGVTEGVLHGLQRAARDIALMERLGPNPKAMFEAVRKRLRDANRDDIGAFDRLGRRKLDDFYAEVSGEVSIPGHVKAARIGQVFRAVQSMAKLGGAVLSSASDLGTRAVNARYQGRSLLSDYADGLASIFRGRGAGEVRDIADSLGVGFEGTIGAMVSRFSAEDDLPGRASKMLNTFFRWNGLSWWTDAQKTGAALMASYDLAKRSGSDWAALGTRLNRVLEQHGLGETEWQVLRHAVHVADDGRRFITPDAVAALAPEEMDGLLGDWIARQTRRGADWPDRLRRQRERTREDLATRLRAYFVEETDFAIPTPGARERAFLRRGTQPGTLPGELLRYMTQFKAFPITVAIRVNGRLLRGQPGADVPGIVHAILGLTVLGYVAMTLKDLAKGRSPRDPLEAKTWAAAFVQGGGAGIYGDFLFGDFNRFGGGLIPTLAGPAGGAAEELAGIWARLRDGDDAAAASFRFALGNTPYVNMFYTRAALDYLLFYQIQELLNPGYLRRFERRVRKQNNQTFLLPPSRVVPHGSALK